MAVVEVVIIPIGTSSPSLSDYVAGCVKVLQEADGINYKLTSMGTIIEGELDRVLDVVRRMHEVPFDRGIGRVVTTIRIDDRRDKTITMDGKVAAVESKLGKVGGEK